MNHDSPRHRGPAADEAGPSADVRELVLRLWVGEGLAELGSGASPAKPRAGVCDAELLAYARATAAPGDT